MKYKKTIIISSFLGIAILGSLINQNKTQQNTAPLLSATANKQDTSTIIPTDAADVIKKQLDDLKNDPTKPIAGLSMEQRATLSAKDLAAYDQFVVDVQTKQVSFNPDVKMPDIKAPVLDCLTEAQNKANEEKANEIFKQEQADKK